MRNILTFMTLLALLAACGHNNAPIPPGTPVVYACPMDCEKGKTYAEKGACPVCKMDLKPVAAPAAPSGEPGGYQMLEKETLAIHDEAMKTMGEMNQLRLEINNFLASATMTPAQNKPYTDALAAMEKAEKDMMSLMPQLHTPEGSTGNIALKYWEDMKQRMTQNHNDMQAAVEAGQKLLGK